jgi:hypothetical protein
MLLDAIAGEPITVDLSARGPWIVPENIPVGDGQAQRPAVAAATLQPSSLPAVPQTASPADKLTGTVTVHNANWKADYLANAVMISQATLHFDGVESRWDPVAFTYGPVKGTATLTMPSDCVAPCSPRFTVAFGTLDAAALQAAILGAKEKGTLLSQLIARLSSKKSATGSTWPGAEGTARAETLLLGPLTLHDATAALRLTDAGVEITSYDAALLGGQVNGNGMITPAGADRDKPAYAIEATFEKLNPVAVGELAGSHWRGGDLGGDGKVELSRFTGNDLASSAHGTIHIDWKHGSVAGERGAIPAELVHFDHWTADAEIANGAITLKDNAVKVGWRKGVVEGALAFGDPAKLTLTAPKETQAKR